MTRAAGNWAGGAWDRDVEGEDVWVSPAQDAMERAMCLLSALRRTPLTTRQQAMLRLATSYARCHTRHLYGEQLVERAG